MEGTIFHAITDLERKLAGLPENAPVASAGEETLPLPLSPHPKQA